MPFETKPIPTPPLGVQDENENDDGDGGAGGKGDGDGAKDNLKGGKDGGTNVGAADESELESTMSVTLPSPSTDSPAAPKAATAAATDPPTTTPMAFPDTAVRWLVRNCGSNTDLASMSGVSIQWGLVVRDEIDRFVLLSSGRRRRRNRRISSRCDGRRSPLVRARAGDDGNGEEDEEEEDGDILGPNPSPACCPESDSVSESNDTIGSVDVSMLPPLGRLLLPEMALELFKRSHGCNDDDGNGDEDGHCDYDNFATYAADSADEEDGIGKTNIINDDKENDAHAQFCLAWFAPRGIRIQGVRVGVHSSDEDTDDDNDDINEDENGNVEDNDDDDSDDDGDDDDNNGDDNGNGNGQAEAAASEGISDTDHVPAMRQPQLPLPLDQERLQRLSPTPPPPRAAPWATATEEVEAEAEAEKITGAKTKKSHLPSLPPSPSTKATIQSESEFRGGVAREGERVQTCTNEWAGHRNAADVLRPFGYDAGFVRFVLDGVVARVADLCRQERRIRRRRRQRRGEDEVGGGGRKREGREGAERGRSAIVASATGAAAGETGRIGGPGTGATFAVRGATVARPEGYCLCWDGDGTGVRGEQGRIAEAPGGAAAASPATSSPGGGIVDGGGVSGDGWDRRRRREEYERIRRRRMRRSRRRERKERRRWLLPRVVSSTRDKGSTMMVTATATAAPPTTTTTTTAQHRRPAPRNDAAAGKGRRRRCVQFLNSDGSRAVRLLTPPFECGPVSGPVTAFVVAIATEDGCFFSGLRRRFELGHMYPIDPRDNLIDRSPVCIAIEEGGRGERRGGGNGEEGGDLSGRGDEGKEAMTGRGLGEAYGAKGFSTTTTTRRSMDTSEDDDDDDSGFKPRVDVGCSCVFRCKYRIEDDSDDDNDGDGGGNNDEGNDDEDPPDEVVLYRGLMGPGLWHCYTAIFDGSNSIVRVDGRDEPPNLDEYDRAKLSSLSSSPPAVLDGLTIGSDHTFDMSLCYGEGDRGEGEGAVAEVALFAGRMDMVDVVTMERYLMRSHGISVVDSPYSQKSRLQRQRVGDVAVGSVGGGPSKREAGRSGGDACSDDDDNDVDDDDVVFSYSHVEDEYRRQAHALIVQPPPFRLAGESVPLRIAAKHPSVAWQRKCEVTGKVIPVSRIGSKFSTGSSDW